MDLKFGRLELRSFEAIKPPCQDRTKRHFKKTLQIFRNKIRNKISQMMTPRYTKPNFLAGLVKLGTHCVLGKKVDMSQFPHH